MVVKKHQTERKIFFDVNIALPKIFSNHKFKNLRNLKPVKHGKRQNSSVIHDF